jgi:hypothetical protein
MGGTREEARADQEKKKPPTPAEAERVASDTVMNDGSLQKGDLVSTDRSIAD